MVSNRARAALRMGAGVWGGGAGEAVMEAGIRPIGARPQPRGSEHPKLAIIVMVAGAVTLTACIAWSISRSSGLTNVSGGDIAVALIVLMVGLLPFVVLALGAGMVGRAVTVVATTLFALVFVAAYQPSSDSSTGSGSTVITAWFLLVIAAFALIGVSEGVRALRRHRAPA
jgi:hypothetical protein